ncbi:MAG: GyrI-like domain-containing protein [Anaerolineales bacterium]|nr:GyrI-like domain-containing protein [Anaerolineales bacterium]
MTVLDLQENFKYLYAPSARQIDIVEVPKLNFVMINGQIEAGKNPDTSESFQDALNMLYGVSSTLKFMSKLNRQDPIDYLVTALEAIWQKEEDDANFARKEGWQGTLMMMQPKHITKKMFSNAVSSLRRRQGEIPAINLMRFESFKEGTCMQILHVGSYGLQSMTVERMRDFAEKKGYQISGPLHEIYLSDPRHAKAEKLRTIVRFPVTKPSNSAL